jgi:MFS transporter, DHA2 family, multidrug resistance protein
MYKKNLLIFLILLAGFILNVVSVQIVSSSFQDLQGALGASVEQISYVMSASLIAEVIIIPFSGWLARLMSTRVLFLISISGFVLSSIGCALSTNFFMMIICRGLQGFFGGAMLPIMTSSIYILFDKKKIPFILSIAATFGVSSIALGPILGGFLTEYLDWRWMFLYNIPVGIIIFLLGYFFVDLSDKEKSLINKIDYRGIIFLAIALISLLIFIEEGQKKDWFHSNFILTTFGIFFIFFIFFFHIELTAKYPVIDLSIFLNRNFFIGCINVVVFAITLYVPIFLLPIFLGQVKNMSPLNIGLIISTMGIAWMLSGPFVGKLLKLIGGRLVVVIGAIFIGIGTYAQTTITADFTINELFISQASKGVGAQFLWIGNQYLSLGSVSSRAIYNAAAMFNLVLRLAAAISISLASSLLIKWKTEFLTELIEIKTYSNINNTLEFNRFYSSNKSDLIFFNYIERESLIMALNKISYVSMWTVLIPLVLMFYIKTKKSKVIY